MYKWQSARTGQIAKDFRMVIRIIWEDLIRFGIINIKWQYKKEGF